MYAPTKQIGYFFLPLLFLNVYAPEINNDTTLSSYHYYITSTIAALIIGKLSYNYFQNHHITPKQTIQYCQSTFRIIQQEIQYYQKLYHNDVQMSDWELKEMILDNNTKPYPFLEYYTSLQEVVLLLQKHRTTVTKQLVEIKKHEKKIPYKNLILELEQEEKDLEHHISKMISSITILKMRVQSFKEYHEDCCYWKEKMGNS